MRIKDLIEDLVEKTIYKKELSRKDVRIFSEKLAERVVIEVNKEMIKKATGKVKGCRKK